MADLATQLLNAAVDDHRPVEITRLTGTFEFDLEWTPVLPVPTDAPPAPPVDPNGPPLFTALREQLASNSNPRRISSTSWSSIEPNDPLKIRGQRSGLEVREVRG